MSLEELTSWLYSRTAGGIKWGLETTRTLLAGGGDPHRRFRSIHVGGTNGKGSVAALCASALGERKGGSVGLYTSPHLVSFRERIQVGGEPVREAVLLDAARRLEPLIEETGASFFEATTAMAFLCFAELGVDIAVVEVGLGGRLDATNVLSPLVTVVTNVALDHTSELGSSLTDVAGEKAGIFKSGAPAITAEVDAPTLAVLRKHAAVAQTDLRVLDEIVTVSGVETDLTGTHLNIESAAWGRRALRVPLVGEHQARNAALAAETLALLPEPRRPRWEDIEVGFSRVRWPGRFQVEQLRGTTWILDVAHNPSGVEALCRTLDRLDLPPPLVLVTGVLSDKPWERMLPPLANRVDAAVLTIPSSAPAARRWDPEAAAEWLRAEVEIDIRVIPDLATAVARASTMAPHGTVVVTGSVHTVGDALATLELLPR